MEAATVREPVPFFGLFFSSPSRSRLSAVSTMDSSLERGVQPNMRLAFSLVAFFILPSWGRIWASVLSKWRSIRCSFCRMDTAFAITQGLHGRQAEELLRLPEKAPKDIENWK